MFKYIYIQLLKNQNVFRIAKKYLRAFCYISIGEPGGGKRDIKYEVEMISEGAKKFKYF